MRYLDCLLLIFLCLLFSSYTSFGQQTNTFVIQSISIEGNKKTKDRIILRELNLAVGDTVIMPDVIEQLKQNELQVLNTGLFTQAQLQISGTNGDKIDLLLTVTEDWYLYPIPVFELADRNFNVWWVEQNRSLDRVNYGLFLVHKNLTGQKDELKVAALTGYSQKLNLAYTLPYINKKQTLGVKFDYLFARNREIGITTSENILQFERLNDTYLLKRFRLNGGITYRPTIKIFHEWNLFFHQDQIDQHVLDINPFFFTPNNLLQRYFALTYDFTYENRDFQPYPMKGFYFNLYAQKEGLGIFNGLDYTGITAHFKQYHTLTKKWSLEYELKGRKIWDKQQVPYYNARALGYFDDYLRGYEYYVIDGQDYGFLKTGLRYQLIDGRIDWGNLMPINAFKTFNFQVFIAFNTDHGYVDNKYYGFQNDFSNRYLSSYGIGLDFLLYSTRLIEVEYTRNHLGEKGLYLHLNLIF